jgi:hypothetical protein
VVKDFAGAGLQNYWYGPWLFKKHVENGVIWLLCNRSIATFLRQSANATTLTRIGCELFINKYRFRRSGELDVRHAKSVAATRRWPNMAWSWQPLGFTCLVFPGKNVSLFDPNQRLLNEIVNCTHMTHLLFSPSKPTSTQHEQRKD